MRKLFCDGAIYGYHSMSETSCIISKRKRERKARLPEDFEDLSLVEILAKTQFQKTYMDVIVKAVEAEIPEKIVKSYIWDAMDEEEIECQIKIQRILQVSDQS